MKKFLINLLIVLGIASLCFLLVGYIMSQKHNHSILVEYQSWFKGIAVWFKTVFAPVGKWFKTTFALVGNWFSSIGKQISNWFKK